MAVSTQLAGTRTHTFNDLDLLVLLGLMTSELERRTDHYRALLPSRSTWAEQRLAYAPGTIDLNLNEILSSAPATQEMTELLWAIMQQLKDFGAIVPARELNSRYSVPGVIFHDYPTLTLAAAIKELFDLIDSRYE